MIFLKNKLIIAVVLLACLIPSVVAFTSYQHTQNAPVDESTATVISIDDINGKNFTERKQLNGDRADTLIRYFLGLKANAQSIVALPDSLMGHDFFKVTISSVVRSETFECYFSTDPSTCYLRASDGTTYKISEADAEEFITSEYAESLYGESAMPVLILSDEFDVQPDQAIWQYKNYTGEFVDSDTSGIVYDYLESYDVEGGINLSFDIEPDYCTVGIVGKDGDTLYDGSLSDIGTFALSTTEVVTVNVTARWYEDPSRAFCGELDYSFSSLVSAPAEFYLGLTTVEAGKFTAITAVNVTKPENIQFTSTIGSEAIAPRFYKYDDTTVIGFLAIPFDLPSGVYSMTLSYGGTVQETNITVENEGERRSNVSVPESMLSTYRTEQTIAEFAEILNTLGSTGSSTKYFEGYFLTGAPSDATLLRGPGRKIYLNGASDYSYISNGIDYSASADLNIVAANGGEVVYASAESAYAGNMVVIEHGFGLKTWYYNLGSVSVSVGDKVARGDVIGTTGQSGFAPHVGAHIAMSVGTNFVSPYDTWEDSTNCGKVIIAKIDE